MIDVRADAKFAKDLAEMMTGGMMVEFTAGGLLAEHYRDRDVTRGAYATPIAYDRADSKTLDMFAPSVYGGGRESRAFVLRHLAAVAGGTGGRRGLHLP